MTTTLLKFLIVGIVNTLIGCGLMFFLYNFFCVSYWISSVCNYVAGGVVSFFLNKYFTFQSNQNSLKQIVLFIINLAICYFIAYFLAKQVVYVLLENQSERFRDNVAMGLGVCLYTMLNYLGQKFIVFKVENKPEVK